MVPNARIRARESTTDLLGSVRRRVVHDDQLEVPEGLGEMGLDGPGEIGLPVVDRKTGADSWPIGCHASPITWLSAAATQPLPGFHYNRTTFRRIDPDHGCDAQTHDTCKSALCE